jgi:hypothetical protein
MAMEDSPLVRLQSARRVAALLIAGATLLLAGCSGGVARSVEKGIPEDLDVAWSGEGPAGAWVDEGRTFAVVTWGSSSCPPVASALEVLAGDHLGLRFDPAANAICTADMAATTHTFDLPSGITSSPLTITISYSDWDGTDTVTLD